MNRMIKFRAWDKTSNLMRCDISSICYNEDGTINQIDVFSGSDILFPDKECELMQFTGLTDKNGKDVFDGDIIHKWDTYRGNDWKDDKVFSQVGAVTFQNGQFTFVYEGCPEQLVDLYEPQMSTLEVIGNIYENPELLK